MRGAFSVDEPSGQRWTLALDLLDSGETTIVFAGRVALFRHVGWPNADGVIHVSVLTAHDQASLRRELAQPEVDRARQVIAELRSSDERFRSLLEQYGEAWDYAADLDTTIVGIAEIDDAGTLVWPPG